MTWLSPVMKQTFGYGAAISFIVIILVFRAFTSRDEKTQPLAYNHKSHIDNASLTCTDCHVTVESSPSATIPSLEVCSTCHSDQPISESGEEKKLLEFVAKGISIPWQRVYSVPDHVYFSHRRHVTKGGLDCKVCHGEVKELITPVSTQFLPTTMENCMKCHREQNVTNDCLSCHR